MRLQRDFLLSVGILVAFNILLAFGAIGLFTRMSPAIERILQENVYSTDAAEEMLALLARDRFPADLAQGEIPVLVNLCLSNSKNRNFAHMTSKIFYRRRLSRSIK